jgi:hypothetical protein
MTETETEQWMNIPGYEGWYQASSAGRFRSLDRLITRQRADGTTLDTRLRHGKIIEQDYTNTKGYARVTLSRDGQSRRYFSHRLMLETFVGPCPTGYEGAHIDDDHTNNAIENLRWSTPEGNIADRKRNGGYNFARRAVCRKGLHSMTDDNVYSSKAGARCCRSCRKVTAAAYYQNNKKVAA